MIVASKTQNCLTCICSVEVRLPGEITTRYNCRRFPPVPVVIERPQGVQLNSMHPFVGSGDLCAEWRPATPPES